MGFKGLFRDKPIVGAGIAMALVAIAAVVVLRPAPPRGNASVYHYDLQTGALIAGERTGADSGSESIIANVFTCGGCEPGQQFIAWLEVIQIEGDNVDHRVAAPPGGGDQPMWMPVHSNEAATLMDAVSTRCEGRPATSCLPQ